VRAAAHAMHLKTALDRVDQRLQRRRVCCLVRRVADASAPATGRLTLSKTVIGRSSPRLRRTCPACSAACPGFRSKSGPSSRSARNRPQPANTTPRADGTILEPGRAFSPRGDNSCRLSPRRLRPALPRHRYPVRCGITPAAKKVIYQPEARARDPVRFPRWRVGLICSSMRNFLAGVIVDGWPQAGGERGSEVLYFTRPLVKHLRIAES
jgi:hypothetical protein